MITFTPDGDYVLVANEGEPSGYGAGQVDPEGSVSIIRIPKSHAAEEAEGLGRAHRVASRSSTARKRACARRASASTAPARRAAQDFEPEYIAVSADSRTAYVTLQENNAIAEIDIDKAKVTKLRAARLQGLQRDAAGDRAPMSGTDRPVDRLDGRGPEDAARRLLRPRLRRHRRATASSSSSRTPIAARTASPSGINRPFLLPELQSAPRALHARSGERRVRAHASRSRCGARTASRSPACRTRRSRRTPTSRTTTKCRSTCSAR